MFTGFRYRRGLTKAAFAELAGFPLEHISEWEERKRMLSPRELRDLATLFNVSVSDLLLKPPKDVSLRHGARKIWTGPKPVVWDKQAQAQWGTSPFQHFGYLMLQLTAGEGPRFYPVSSEQAWWLQSELGRRSSSEMVIGKTLSNRVLMFAQSQVYDAKVLSAAEAVGKPNFQLNWDENGLAPEVYRLLRNWARKDNSEYFESSPALHRQRDAVLDKPGMRRRAKIAALVDDTYVFRISDVPIAVSAEAANLQTAVRSLRLGMLTAYFAEREGTTEWLVPIEDIRLIDAPALDIEEFRQFDVVASPSPMK